MPATQKNNHHRKRDRAPTNAPTHLLLGIRHSSPGRRNLAEYLGVGELGVVVAVLVANGVLEFKVGRRRALGGVGVLNLLDLLLLLAGILWVCEGVE